MIHSAFFYSVCFLVLNGVFGGDSDEVKSVSVTEGDAVTLNTDLTEIQKNDHILWMFGPQDNRIAENYKQNIDIYNNVIFREILKMDSQTGSLTITNIRTEHTGLYKLQIIRNSGTSYKRFNVTVFASLPIPDITRDSSQCSSSSSSPSLESSTQKCSVVCSVANVGHVTLSWLKGNSLLSSITVSDLSISLSLPLEVEDQDNNTYSCEINNTIRHQTTHLDISALCHTCSDSVQCCGSTEAVIRLVISALVGLAAVAVVIYDIRS